MKHAYKTLKLSTFWIAFLVSVLLPGACTTTEVALATLTETLPEAITVPYRVSTSGHFVVDIAVNDQTAQPFIVDTGATVSSIYDKYTKTLDLSPSRESTLIRGLVTTGARPIIEDVEFKIDTRTFVMDRVAVLETPETAEGAVGLLGEDVLADYTVVFNKERMTATIVPSKFVRPSSFIGWRRIPLKNKVGAYPDRGLHFSQIALNDRNIPVLIDTGSNVNIVNWHLATLDEEMRKLQRRLREGTQLQGAIDTSTLEITTRFFDVVLGTHYWPSINVIVTDLDTLSTVAPTDKPMMIAGAEMFTPWTVAFDLGGDMIYVRANSDDPRPPSRSTNIRQSQFSPLSDTTERD